MNTGLQMRFQWLVTESDVTAGVTKSHMLSSGDRPAVTLAAVLKVIANSVVVLLEQASDSKTLFYASYSIEGRSFLS